MLPSIDDKPYTEILDGEAVQKVSPQRRHSLLQARLAVILTRLVANRGDIGTEWRFYMDPPGGLRTSLVPDIAFVARERMQRLSPDDREKPPLSPDVAIEIRSPGDKRRHVEWKMHAYLRMGGTVALDVDPDRRAIHVYEHDAVRTYGQGDRLACDALPWFAFDIDELFAGLD